MRMTIEECFKWLEYHKQGEVGKAVECIDIVMNIMRKYQKIQEIIDDYEGEGWERIAISDISEVLNDGDDD